MRAPGVLTGLLFPKKCPICRALLQGDDAILCRSCRIETEEVPSMKRPIPFLSGATALWYYEGKVRGSLLRFKFYRKRSYARSYGALLTQKLQDKAPGYDLITWVPVSRRRKLQRGYDQTQLILRAMGDELGIPKIRCLKKIRHTPPQSGIHGIAARRANVLNAYRVTDPEAVAGKRILLLDDIITTGTTISEAARVLMTAGAKEVYGVAVTAARQHKHETSR